MPRDLLRAALENGGPRLLYSLPEARAMLGGIGHTTIYELFKRDQLKRVNIGRRSFVTAESIAALVNRLNEAASTDRKTVIHARIAEVGGGGDDAA